LLLYWQFGVFRFLIAGKIRLMKKLTQNPLFAFFATLVLIALLSLFGPEEKSLGPSVRIVYLHGAWVLAAEAAFVAAALAGALGLLAARVGALASRQQAFYDWSAALGRTGIVFWVTYLPLSLWAMQANWNGLFLAEPRFRLALTFAVVGLLLQVGLWLFSLPWVTAWGNILFISALLYTFSNADYVMHPPPSPIFNSGISAVILFFLGLIALAGLAAWFLTRSWLMLAGKQNEKSS
jgi:hypothetical protein